MFTAKNHLVLESYTKKQQGHCLIEEDFVIIKLIVFRLKWTEIRQEW